MRLRGLLPSAKGAILIAQRRKGHRGVVRAAAEHVKRSYECLTGSHAVAVSIYAHIFAIGGRLR